MIDLISDTITKPTRAMREFMMNAEVGDDVFGEDPNVNLLEEKVAQMFSKEAAVFCPSGTMTNQIAIKVHTKPLDEVICHEYSHIYQYETGGYSFHSGIAINLLGGDYGKINAAQILDAIKPKYDWLPESRLVVLENSTNKGGGNYYTLDELKPIHQVCKEHNLKLHLDGARIFNVLVETGESTQEIGILFDSISISLSKGLGAPIGSVLTGGKKFITQARRVRKVMGGGMRQAGIIAAAGIFALDHHVSRLKEDNDRAKILGAHLATKSFVKFVWPVKTNIVLFDIIDEYSCAAFLDLLKSNGIRATSMGTKTIRFTTHMGFDDEMLEKTIEILDKIG